MVLTAQDVSFAYRRTAVLDGVTLSVARGEVLGVLGPNGSGKSTLLQLLAGILIPVSGHVALDGRPLSTVSRHEVARRIAVVPQDLHTTFDYTVLEIVLMGRYPWLATFEVEGPEDVTAARAALEQTGIAHLADRRFATLSGGERQRAVIAAALAQLDTRRAPTTTTGVLILDEPTTALDLRYQLEVVALVHRLRASGATIVLSTHDLSLARTVCSRLVFLANGRLTADGPPSDLLIPASLAALYGVDPGLIPAWP